MYSGTAPWSTEVAHNAESTPQDDLKLPHPPQNPRISRAFLMGTAGFEPATSRV
jgi:hypothetical protein